MITVIYRQSFLSRADDKKDLLANRFFVGQRLNGS